VKIEEGEKKKTRGGLPGMEGVASPGSQCEASSGICGEVNVIATREGRN